MPTAGLGVGEVGYLITGVKDVRQSRVGDTITYAAKPATDAARRLPRPEADGLLRPVPDGRLGLPAAARRAGQAAAQRRRAGLRAGDLSAALGFGYRCGFLGLLHLEIVRDRLEREFGLDLISTAPNVVYRVVLEDGDRARRHQPVRLAGGQKIAAMYEPIVKAMIIAPSEYIGAIMELCQSRRGSLGGMDYLSETRVELRYTLPLAEIIFDFFDQLKSRTRGYA